MSADAAIWLVMPRARTAVLVLTSMLATELSSSAQMLVEMQHGFPGARYVPVYSTGQRAKAIQNAMALSAPPVLSRSISLTPNAPYAPNGSHLSFWKPSFVIGTANGGEAGINYWGKYQEGHMNVGLVPASGKSIVLDCRMQSTGGITYKIYAGNSAAAYVQGEVPLRDGHFLLTFAVSKTGKPISVELWPMPETQTVGIFGCDLSTLG